MLVFQRELAFWNVGVSLRFSDSYKILVLDSVK